MKKKEHILNSSVTVTLSCSSHSSAWDRSRKRLHKTASLFRSLYVAAAYNCTDTLHSTIYTYQLSTRGLDPFRRIIHSPFSTSRVKESPHLPIIRFCYHRFSIISSSADRYANHTISPPSIFAATSLSIDTLTPWGIFTLLAPFLRKEKKRKKKKETTSSYLR